MIYFKSILAGIGAVMITLVLVIGAFTAWQYSAMSSTGSGGIGLILFDVDLVVLLLICSAVFAAGFYWQFRRASAKNSL